MLQVDLCFLVDCTGSMSSYIEAVKNNVKQLRDDLVAQYKGCDIRFAFVRYTDYDQPESTRTTFIDFTTLVKEGVAIILVTINTLLFYSNQSAFHSFVSGIVADGGGDSPEDIMGGLNIAFKNLSWRSGGSRVKSDLRYMDTF